MWALLFVFVLQNGQVILDLKPVASRSECEVRAAEVAQWANKEDKIKAFQLACRELKIT